MTGNITSPEKLLSSHSWGNGRWLIGVGHLIGWVSLGKYKIGF